MRENRETPLASGSSTPDRLEKATSNTTSMHTSGESDEQVVPTKRANKEEQSSAEGVEGSCSTKGNTEEAHTRRTQGRERVSQGLGGVREAARRDKEQKFTALLHHVTTDLLRDSYYSLKRAAAPGVAAQFQEKLISKLNAEHQSKNLLVGGGKVEIRASSEGWRAQWEYSPTGAKVRSPVAWIAGGKETELL